MKYLITAVAVSSLLVFSGAAEAKAHRRHHGHFGHHGFMHSHSHRHFCNGDSVFCSAN